MQIWNSRAHAGVLHLLIILGPVAVVAVVPAMATATAGSITQVPAAAGVAAAPDCRVAGQSGAAVPKAASATGAVRTTIGVARAMHVPRKGQMVAVMVMFQESTIRNLANDGSSAQRSAWAPPGRAYWLRVSRLSLKYPHDLFGTRDGAYDTDSIGLYQQRPAWGWGNYGGSTGTSDPEGVVQRLLDPRWESMDFFGGPRSAAGNWGLLDVPGWEHMAATDAAEAVQGSTRGNLYAKWEPLATQLVKANSDTPAIALPWYPGGAAEALTCTGIPTDQALGEAGRNPWTHLDLVALQELPWTGPGRHTICATAINIGRGTANPRIGCRSLAVRAPSPLRSPGGPRTTGDQPAVSERTDRSSAPAVSSSPDSRPPKAPTATAPSP